MGTFELAREIYTTNILMFIRANSPTSRLAISEHLNLPKPTLSRMIDSLIKEGLVIEEGFGESTGGRRPTLLSFNANRFFSIGISLGRSAIKVALTNLNGEILIFMEASTQNMQTADSIFSFIKNAYFEITREVDVEESLILGIGVGLPGPLKRQDNLISTPTFFNGEPTPIVEYLQEFINVPIIIEKDANVAALAEKWFGLGKDKQNFIYVMSSVGVGCGLIINEQLYRGVHGEAGGLGHTTINVFGEKCNCGNFGCLETIVSTSKVVERIIQKLKLNWGYESQYYDIDNIDNINIDHIIQAYRKGSTIAKQELEEVGKYLGVGVANIVTFFDPELIIIGGKLGSVNEVVDSLKQTLAYKVLGSHGREVPVLASQLDEGVVLGSAALVIDNVFTLFSNYTVS